MDTLDSLKITISVRDLLIIDNILRKKGIIDDEGMWIPPQTYRNISVIEAIQIIKNGGDNPGIPKINNKCVLKAYNAVFGKYNLVHLSVYFINSFMLPCFDPKIYNPMASIAKKIKIKGALNE